MTHPRRNVSRRGFVVGAAGLGAAALLPASTTAASAAPSTRSGPRPDGSSRSRAEQSWRALQTYFRTDDGSGLYREQHPSASNDNPYSYEWPFSQAHVAALDLTGMAGVGRRYDAALRDHVRAQRHYRVEKGTTGLPGYGSYPPPPYGAQAGDIFYDDNEWVGLKDVQQHLMGADRDGAALRDAERIFDLVVSAWDDDDSHAAPGGFFWAQAAWSQDRNTVSNMPAAELGLRLHRITGKGRYRDWALRAYRWTNEHLQRDSGLYDDHLSLTGEVEDTVWSYNQGVPVGVNVLLHAQTGKRRHLDEAERIADAAARWFDSSDHPLEKQPPFFNSIYFKNLLLLDAARGRSTYRKAMEAWADHVWRHQRDDATGLFLFDQETAPGTTQMIQQAAMTQVYAVLAWPRSRYRLLY
ncbi:Predicted alpha-1,6-mannanase, GH76 family [Microlunatus sagamiharensis]|uniref:Predicted alpha-1,6-mannanase, GH76 family n=1 Tax=Microlunatus sagamiharensis TaxID=546874 RepID=A0A1H2N1F5_9ACTN|nr:glycoside hydrolase family 76 protein [Microlunatus sagamiharensis]SDU99202.1 Predicted alpha-1,6-mannanase, GH76 family [Microlunatus sagamiharensis]